MKYILKAIVTVIASVVLLIGFLYFYTGGMTSVADDFFDAVSSDEIDQADKQLSQYIASDSAPIYRYLKSNDMNEVKSSSWHARNFVNNKGTIAGEVINAQGAVIPTRIDFVKEDGDWKIYAIDKQSPKAKSTPSEPDMQQQKYLVRQSMSYFMDAAKRKSMNIFHENISAFWQSQITVAELDKAFASIYNFNGDHSFLSRIDPTIQSAVIDENNLLVVEGFFPLNPSSSISVKQKYIYEGTAWKLISFSYNSEKT